MNVVHRRLETVSGEEQRQALLGIHKRCVTLLRGRETKPYLHRTLSCDTRGR